MTTKPGREGNSARWSGKWETVHLEKGIGPGN